VHVVGTAGHVDHGKSSLVRALTGTDPDRWLEERARGMTLDLGFAALRFDDGLEAGIVDVPGHERFLHNMLAGAAGMELLLLVVAANEGPGKQTAEHLAILQYLNVKRTLLVLTKVDLLGAAELPFAIELVRDALRGTIADDAPCFAVSSTTGAGIAELRSAIHAELAVLPPREPDAPPHLPLDRVFSLPGHGTIVTGTLMQGRIAAGDELRLEPPGRTVRVRSLEVFGEQRAHVEGGARVAVNLPGVERADVARGAVLAGANALPAARFEVRFRPLPGTLAMLRRRTPVRAYIGSAEILGTLVFESVPLSLDTVPATLHLREPALAVPGSAFVVRRLSPKDVLGGGTLAAAGDAAPEPGLDARATAVLAVLRDAGLAGADVATVAAAANLREDAALEALSASIEEGRAVALARPAGFLASDQAEALFERVRARLEASESESPWLAGLTTLALSRAFGIPETTLGRVLAAFAEQGRIAHRSGYFSTPGFRSRPSPEQRDFFERAFRGDVRQPYQPVEFEGLLGAMRAARIPGLSASFDALLADGTFVKVGGAVYRDEQIAALRARLESALAAGPPMTPAAFRDLAGTSRKFAVPLLEWFDAAGITLREGDVRVLRRAPLGRELTAATGSGPESPGRRPSG
jgi:selenocysteine-specific elongation factor